MDEKQDNKYKLEQLFNSYYTALLLYSIAIVKDEADAKDIVQQAFVTLWRKMGEMDFHTSVKAWLYKTVYNASLDFIKHKKVKREYETHIKFNSTVTTTQQQQGKELQDKIKAAVNELPVQCGLIFKLSREEGLRYKEIATKLGIAEKTVENQMGKALELLREAPADYLPVILLFIHLFYGRG